MTNDERLTVADKFKGSEHKWVFSLVMSPRRDEGLTYPPLSLEEAIAEAEQFGPVLCGIINNFYGGVSIKTYGGAYNEDAPLIVYVLSNRGNVVADILLQIEPYRAEDKKQESFTLLAFLNMGVEDYKIISRLMDGELYDQVVLRNKGRILDDEGGEKVNYYALLFESEPKGIGPKNYWMNDELVGKIGFRIGRYRIYEN